LDKSIVRRLEELFSLTKEQTTPLIELVGGQREQASDYYQFTRLINQEFSPDQNVKLIEFNDAKNILILTRR
jgi:uncharacterized tellurite resistance protein B-like protein